MVRWWPPRLRHRSGMAASISRESKVDPPDRTRGIVNVAPQYAATTVLVTGSTPELPPRGSEPIGPAVAHETFGARHDEPVGLAVDWAHPLTRWSPVAGHVVDEPVGTTTER